MSVVRTHHYTVEPADLDELLARRGALIAAIREAHPGLTTARLVRLADGSYSDTWHWESDAQLGAALAALGGYPEAPRTMALTRDGTAQNGEIIDER